MQKSCILLSAKGCNYCTDVKRDLTLRIPSNCRTVWVNTAAPLQEIAKAKLKRVKMQPHAMLIYVDGCSGGKRKEGRRVEASITHRIRHQITNSSWINTWTFRMIKQKSSKCISCHFVAWTYVKESDIYTVEDENNHSQSGTRRSPCG